MALNAKKKIANHLKINGAFLSLRYNFLTTKNKQKNAIADVTKEMIVSPKTTLAGVIK